MIVYILEFWIHNKTGSSVGATRICEYFWSQYNIDFNTPLAFLKTVNIVRAPLSKSLEIISLLTRLYTTDNAFLNIYFPLGLYGCTMLQPTEVQRVSTSVLSSNT